MAGVAAQQLTEVLENFEGRHRNLLEIFEARAAEMEDAFDPHADLTQDAAPVWSAPISSMRIRSRPRRLFNPSIVRHPDQTGAPEGGCRFILSLRAVGEGHISSLTFRSGIDRRRWQRQRSIPPRGSHRVPSVRIANARPNGDDVEVVFRTGDDFSERVIFPMTDAQSNGIEDARFVEFEDEGRTTYYATYTAYSGRAIRSELIETTDFLIVPHDAAARRCGAQQGHGAVPAQGRRPVRNDGRQDNENLYTDLFRRSLHLGRRAMRFCSPEYPWEFVQIGNCGSPIELDEGWLLLTHGVGPIRKYSIGAVLLDKEDPSKVLARSREPLVRPEPARTRGLRAQCRLHLRRHAPRRPDHPALRRLGYLLELRHHQDR